jgi:hypothetical protein
MNIFRCCLHLGAILFFVSALSLENLSASTFFVDSVVTQAAVGQGKVKKSKKSASSVIKSTKDSIQYDVYRGMWFEISFPLGWQVRPSLKGNQDEDNSVFFTALDSAAEFYVYCPRYSGSPTDIEINRETEQQLGQNIEEKDGVRIRTVSMKAKDGSYTRVFEDTVAFIVGRRLVFGFKFRDAAALKKYDPVYVHFKSSFHKFVD